MNQTSDKTTKRKKRTNRSAHKKDFGSSTTSELPLKAVIETIPIATRSYLKITGFTESERIIELEGREVVIGRSPECAIYLPVDTVSRNHARVFLRNEEYTIEDLQSANGVYVNGVKAVKCVLRNNDHITIGEVRMVFHEDQLLEKKKVPL